MAPASSADEHFPGETRAERRRRLQAQHRSGAPSGTPEPAPLAPATDPWAQTPGPYDPHPYGVRAYPDIEDAVIAEYVEDHVPYPLPPVAGDVSVAEEVFGPEPGVDAPLPYDDLDPAEHELARAPYVLPADPPADGYSEPGPAAVADPLPEPTAARPAGAGDPWREEPGGDPTRHVAHRAYGTGRPRGAQLPPEEVTGGSLHSGVAASGDRGTDLEPPSGGAPRGDQPTSWDTAAVATATGHVPTGAASTGPAATGAAPGTSTPLAGLAEGDDPTAIAARLQLIAAQAAAERLAGPRRAIDAQSAAERAAEAERKDRERRAAERIAADKVAAARLAAVRAAAAQRETGASRVARANAQAARAGHELGAATSSAGATGVGAGPPAPRPALPGGPSGAPGNHASGRPGGPGARTPGPGGVRPRDPRKRTPRWAKVGYSTAALAVLAGGLVLTAPHVGALLSSGPAAMPSQSPTSAAAAPTTTASGSASATGTGTPAAAPTAVSSAMACDPSQWAGEMTGEAAEVFTASAVAQAYCLTAGTVRDIGFTDLAAKKAAPYTAADFAFVSPYLSPALRGQWDKDVAEFVKTQDLASESARRLSALSALAWDREGLKFDPGASARATDFAVGKPVTWVSKGKDGVQRLGVGFETGIVTHMVDASGKKADRILKRTYKIELVKGDAARPWLIDGYVISQAMAGLNTTTLAPTTPARQATPTTRATR